MPSLQVDKRKKVFIKSLLGKMCLIPSLQINDKRKKVFIRSLLGLPMFWHSNKTQEMAFSAKIVQEIT